MKKLLVSFLNSIQKIIHHFIPPPEWRFSVIMLLGIFVGLGVYVLYISNATSYLSKDPRACINCHVMTTHYATWERSSHVRTATCVDCHIPHDNIFRTYQFKAKDGMRHATIFTMRAEPQVIKIKEDGIAVVQENCIRCHNHVVHKIPTYQLSEQGQFEERLCWDCHRQTPHGRTTSLSTVPHVRVPRLQKVIPRWLEDIFVPND